jgi:hypothetical protein
MFGRGHEGGAQDRLEVLGSATCGESRRLADRAGGGPGDDLGRDAEAGVVGDARDDRTVSGVFDLHPSNDVHPPQLHRAGPLPPAVVGWVATALLRLDEPVADRRAAGDGAHAVGPALVADAPGAPAGMVTAEGDDACSVPGTVWWGRALLRGRVTP